MELTVTGRLRERAIPLPAVDTPPTGRREDL
jgi:hypothetical protein